MKFLEVIYSHNQVELRLLKLCSRFVLIFQKLIPINIGEKTYPFCQPLDEFSVPIDVVAHKSVFDLMVGVFEHGLDESLVYEFTQRHTSNL